MFEQFKCLILLVILIVLPTLTHSHGPIRSQKLENHELLTINPKIKIEGPIYRHKDSLEKGHGTKVLSIIIQESHKRALKEYYEAGDFKAYYAFLLASLTVPMHEAYYVHFRQVSNRERNLCNPTHNAGKKLKLSLARQYFQQYFIDQSPPFLLKCPSFEQDDIIYQLISGGWDGSDVGIMQINIRWHAEEFFAPKLYESVRKSVRYGLNHYMKGFKKVYSDYHKYDCFYNKGDPINYEYVIRGAYAGKYNGGNNEKKTVCRFVNRHSNSNDFKVNLEKAKSFDKDDAMIGHNEELELKPDNNVRKAIQEIVSNYKNKTNTRTYIEKILNDYRNN